MIKSQCGRYRGCLSTQFLQCLRHAALRKLYPQRVNTPDCLLNAAEKLHRCNAAKGGTAASGYVHTAPMRDIFVKAAAKSSNHCCWSRA